MENILIVHHNDNDGYGAAAIIKYALMKNNADPSIIQFKEASYDKPLSSIIKGDYRSVYLVDYSISTKENAEYILDLDKTETDVIWIDHHKSSIDMIDEYPGLQDVYGYRVIGISGTGLSWIYAINHLALPVDGLKEENVIAAKSLVNQIDGTYTEVSDIIARSILINLKIPNTLLLIHRYDIWDCDDKVLDFTKGLYLTSPQDLMSSINNKHIDMQTCDKAIEDGVLIRRYVEREDRKQCKLNGFEWNLTDKNGKTYKCFALNTNHFTSLTFGDLVYQYDIVVPFSYDGNNWTYSLYSTKDDVDCSEIAKQFGGGGHKAAAGFRSHDLIVNKRFNYII